jgi:hypothetical protein
MPRNSSGTETLPAGNPVTSGTTIGSTWGNATIGDLAAEITNSLDRNGRGGMLAPMRVPDGTVAAPTVAFTSETGSGWFRSTAGVLQLAILGVWRLSVSAVGAAVNGTLACLGYLQVRATAGTGKAVNIQPASTTVADFTLTLPDVPGSTLPLTMTGGGVVSASTLSRSMLPSVGQQVSSSCGAFSTASATFVDVTNLTVTITTSGRPVLVIMQPDGSGATPGITSAGSGGGVTTSFLQILRGATPISAVEIGLVAGAAGVSTIVPPSWSFIDVVGAGTYTYKVQAKRLEATTIASVYQCILVAFEL